MAVPRRRYRRQFTHRSPNAGYSLRMPVTDPSLEERRCSETSAADDSLGQPAEVPKGGWRDRMRSKPGVAHAYRIGVFILGLLCIVVGFGLAVLPGPLTIPPV